MLVASISVKAQKLIVESPRIDYYKQTITIYTDSALTLKKDISLDFQKFKLLSYKNGAWKAERTGLSAQPLEVVYIKDSQFIKTPEYREVIENYDPTAKERHKKYYAALIKQYGKKIGNGIYFGVPTIGMTTKQFYMCKDRPDDTNTTNTGYGTSEQLVYRYGQFGTKYYYFTNGKLSAIQD